MNIFYFLVVLIFAASAQVQAKEKFLWGVANAAFQVEGSPQASDWYDWTHTAGKIADGTDADQATDFWNLYERDFKLAADLGANSFRMSIAWERIEPQRDQWNQEALAHYQKIIEKMRGHGLEPIITLHHFVLPKWLADEGGLLSSEFPQLFAQFAQHVVSALSREPAGVRLWITFNEPNVLAMNGYVSGDWPPGIKGDIGKALKAQSQMAEAHIQAQREIKKLLIPSLKLGVAQHWRVFQPKSNSFLDRKVNQFLDFSFNRYFINILNAGSPCSKFFSFFCPASSLKPGERVLDFIGINYYGRTIASFTGPPSFYKTEEGPGPKSDIGWEIYPSGIYATLKDVARYNLPILITENGIADHGDNLSDKLRGVFLKDHINYMIEAKNEEIDVMGYLHWSLTDNFEWTRGKAPRFGLVEIDYKTQTRLPRNSFKTYQGIIAAHSL